MHILRVSLFLIAFATGLSFFAWGIEAHDPWLKLLGCLILGGWAGYLAGVINL